MSAVTLKGYVDGALVGSTPAIFDMQGVPMTWAQAYIGENAFSGIIDDVRLYRRALSPTEIQDLSLVAMPSGNG